MRLNGAIAALLLALSAQGQTQCEYKKTLVVDWPDCGEKIIHGTPLGDILGVPEGTVINMQQPNGSKKLTIRVYLYASDSADCPLKRWWIEGWRCNDGPAPSGLVRR